MTITLDASNLNTAAGARLTGTDSVKQAQQTQISTAAQTQTVQTRKYDTVELSDEAQQYLSTENTTEEQQNTEVSSMLSSSTEEKSSSELYSYTDDQLSELLSKGEITQLQYNTEMAKRSSDD